MLNRRNLRVKVMQTLFAYHQCKRSNFEVALERVAEAFSPDLNSMEEQDPAKLEEDRKKATELFNQHYEHRSAIKSEDPIIADTVERIISEYYSNIAKDFKFLKGSMVSMAEGIERTFLAILALPVKFSDLAAKQDTSHISPEKYVKNLLIEKFRYENSLQKLILDKKTGWGDNEEIVRKWYRDLVRKDPEYIDYLTNGQSSFEEDLAIVNHLLRNVILKSETVNKFFEEEDINWAENFSVVKSMIKKLMKSISEQEPIELPQLSYSWEEDKEFFEKLFVEAVEEEKFVEPLIAERIKNWEMERVAAVDKVILDLAVTELKNFPSIPVKVTINEYIEISKKYSTPKSKQFINGILDVVAKDLQAEGLVKKSGRGLIDNK